jgi:signal transduction histidine kinase
MTYRTKQIIFVVLLALCTVGSAAVAWWSADEARRNLSAVRIADEVLALHLNLASNANDLFKQYADALLIGDRDGGAREAVLRQAIADDFDRVRGLITREIRFQGDDEAEELNRLAAIERELTGIEADFARIARARERLGDAADVAPLVQLLDERIDTRLRSLVDEAVAEERAEVAETSERATSLVLWAHRLAEAALAVMLITAIAAVVVLRRSLDRPLNALLDGTRALREGRLDHRIEYNARDEFGVLAESFNAMANELQGARSSLETARASLEREVSERTAALEDANARLAEQDVMRRRFLADISHELRTPLTIIRGEAEVALRSRGAALDEGAKEALRATVENADRMAQLVDDLLFVARREAGEARLALRPVRIGSLIDAAVADARTLGRANDVSIRVGEIDAGIVVEADQSRLRQLLLVLLDNAVRYSSRGGEVRVSLLRGPGIATIRVEDDGVGIPSDDLPRVFERFVRGRNAPAGGSGLGLPVARAIADAHGGELHLVSEEGTGTAANFTLPIALGPRAVA